MKIYFGLMGALCPEIKQIINIPIGIFKPPIVTFLILLCFVFAAKAQEIEVYSTPVAKADTEINHTESIPLKIGDKIPDELWDLPLEVVNHPEGREIITLGDYRGKVIILDFWATWCAPCISSLHKLDTLQEQLMDDLIVIPTTYESKEKVRPFLSKRKIRLPTLVQEVKLNGYFPHRSIPHQVWLKNGEVLAITGSANAKLDNITKVINNQNVKMVMKIEDMSIDIEEPIKVNDDHLNNANILYSAVFSRRVNAQISGSRRLDNQLSAYNLSYLQIIQEAFSTRFSNAEFNKRVIWEVNDSLKNQLVRHGFKLTGDYDNDIKYQEWQEENTYCYNVSLNESLGKRRQYLNDVFRKESNQFFQLWKGVKFNLTRRKMDCWVLVKTKNFNKANNKNARHSNLADTDIIKVQNVGKLLTKLRTKLSQQPLPIVDGTDLNDEPIYIELNKADRNIEDLCKQLNSFGLDLVKQNVLTDVIVVNQYEAF